MRRLFAILLLVVTLFSGCKSTESEPWDESNLLTSISIHRTGMSDTEIGLFKSQKGVTIVAGTSSVEYELIANDQPIIYDGFEFSLDEIKRTEESAYILFSYAVIGLGRGSGRDFHFDLLCFDGDKIVSAQDKQKDEIYTLYNDGKFSVILPNNDNIWDTVNIEDTVAYRRENEKERFKPFTVDEIYSADVSIICTTLTIDGDHIVTEFLFVNKMYMFHIASALIEWSVEDDILVPIRLELSAIDNHETDTSVQ